MRILRYVHVGNISLVSQLRFLAVTVCVRNFSSVTAVNKSGIFFPYPMHGKISRPGLIKETGYKSGWTNL